MDELVDLFEGVLKEKGIQADRSYTCRVLKLTRERAFFVPDLWEQSRIFYQSPENFDDKVIQKVWKEDTPELVREIKDILNSIHPFEVTTLEPALKEFVIRKEIGLGQVMSPLRLALVGSNQGPGLMDMMEVLGKQEVLHRIDTALEKLK